MFQKAKRKEDQPANGSDGQPNDDIACALGVRLYCQFHVRQSFGSYDALFRHGPFASSPDILAFGFGCFGRR